MFFRIKKVRSYSYLQIVENHRFNGKPQQRVIATLGQFDKLQNSGKLNDLLTSGARFTKNMMILSAHREGKTKEISKKKIGGPIIFERLWRESGCQESISYIAKNRKFTFDPERAIFTTVLHRLIEPGSDRACEKWKEYYAIDGGQHLKLHHFYRSMGWLGKPLGPKCQDDATPFSPRCMKDKIEEDLFQRRRDLFTTMDLMFFDTTSIYFEGEGGSTLGQRGHSKDHRPDLKQMVVGALLDGEGHPICCELWPGNTTDVSTLVPVAKRMKKRFGVQKTCLVADRGMISGKTIKWLEDPEHPWPYILGARMRKQKEVNEEVLSRAGRYSVIHGARESAKSPSPLKVKEVMVKGHRYVICYNEEQARKDAADRDAIVNSLTEKLRDGSLGLVGNQGYRKFLKASGTRFQIDEEKINDEARYDGKWVLRTNTELTAAEVALKYKQLWMVEDLFRSLKSILSTRPIYHKVDDTIRGHVFCSFLALVLRKELMERLSQAGLELEWDDVIRDLDGMEEVEIEQDEKRFRIRLGAHGSSGKVFRAVGVAVPPMIR